MADSYIQVADDGSGKKMQTVVNTVGANSVHAEAVTLVDSTGAVITTLPVSTLVKQYAGVPSNFSVATADGTVFTLAAGEIGFIQNLDSADALAVKKGASASTSSFSFILPCGAAQDDGRGGSVIIDDWVGAVSVAAMTGTGRYIAYKQAAA